MDTNVCTKFHLWALGKTKLFQSEFFTVLKFQNILYSIFIFFRFQSIVQAVEYSVMSETFKEAALIFIIYIPVSSEAFVVYCFKEPIVRDSNIKHLFLVQQQYVYLYSNRSISNAKCSIQIEFYVVCIFGPENCGHDTSLKFYQIKCSPALFFDKTQNILPIIQYIIQDYR